jgi:hypothetical protein
MSEDLLRSIETRATQAAERFELARLDDGSADARAAAGWKAFVLDLMREMDYDEETIASAVMSVRATVSADGIIDVSVDVPEDVGDRLRASLQSALSIDAWAK